MLGLSQAPVLGKLLEKADSHPGVLSKCARKSGGSASKPYNREYTAQGRLLIFYVRGKLESHKWLILSLSCIQLIIGVVRMKSAQENRSYHYSSWHFLPIILLMSLYNRITRHSSSGCIFSTILISCGATVFYWNDLKAC